MRTFAEFWPHYLRQHAHRGSRRLHAAGTLLAVAVLVAAAVTGRWWLALVAPAAGYGAAWLGHLLEGNRPATFGHPLWSLAADLRMAALLASGRLDAHLERRLGGGSGSGYRPVGQDSGLPKLGPGRSPAPPA